MERTFQSSPPPWEVKPKYAFFAKYQYIIIPLQDCIIIDTKSFFSIILYWSQLCRRWKLCVFSVLPHSPSHQRYVKQRTIMGYEIAILAGFMMRKAEASCFAPGPHWGVYSAPSPSCVTSHPLRAVCARLSRLLQLFMNRVSIDPASWLPFKLSIITVYFANFIHIMSPTFFAAKSIICNRIHNKQWTS